MSRGRLTAPAVVQFTGLTPCQVKHGLAVLIQQQLVLWSDPITSVVHYDANQLAVHALLRSGKFAQVVEDRFGSVGESVFSDYLLSGPIKLGELEENRKLSRTDVAKTEQILSMHASIYSLLDSGFLRIAHRYHYRSEADNYTAAEKAAKEPYEKLARDAEMAQKTEGTKKAEVAKMAKLARTASEAFKTDTTSILNFWKHDGAALKSAIRKRGLDTWDSRYLEWDKIDEVLAKDSGLDDRRDQRPTKKRRMTNGKTQDYPSKSLDANVPRFMDKEIVLQVNNDKFAVAARTNRLIQLASERIGPVTAQVYALMLKRLDTSLHCCREDKPDLEAPPVDETETLLKVGTTEFLDSIENFDFMNNSLTAPGGIGPKFSSSTKRLKPTTNGTTAEDETSPKPPADQNVEMLDADEKAYQEREMNRNALREHLLILAKHPTKFLHQHARSPTATEAWSVPFIHLASELRQHELDKFIVSRFGSPALRIVSILRERGKLVEKYITDNAFLDAKVVRATLGSMHAAGILEVQEIPRDNVRQYRRMIFFYFFDADRCAKNVLENTTQTMARTLQRLRAERNKVKDVLEKAERTDVVGKEEQLLAKPELAMLRDFQAKEEKLFGELGRLDDLALVLRDF